MEEVITLFCSVHGESRRDVFSVEIGNKPISDLKDAIKEKKPNDFVHIDADKLTLWKVSIPINKDTDAVLDDLVLENNDEKGIRELEFPSDDIFDVFEVDSEKFVRKNIHVIVQPPVTG